jgi:hypothetical protein
MGNVLGFFCLWRLVKYYKIRDAKVKLNNEFMVKFYEHHNTGQLLASWWKEDKKFVNRAS